MKVPPPVPGFLWKDIYRIHIYETTADGRVSPSSLCDYCQDAATRHYFSIDRIIGPLLAPSQIWALTRLELEIGNLPGWEESVEVETWSRGIGKASAFRDFLIRDKAGEDVAKGTTSWVVLDRATGRIVRLDDFGKKWPSIPDRSVLGRDAAKIAAPGSPSFSRAFTVGYADLDVNRHVNSIRYVRWMLDAVGLETLSTRRLASLAVNFLGEARAADEARVAIEKRTDREFFCSVLLVPDDREVARARFLFG